MAEFANKRTNEPNSTLTARMHLINDTAIITGLARIAGSRGGVRCVRSLLYKNEYKSKIIVFEKGVVEDEMH